MLRGDIHELRPRKTSGHEQRGRRYYVIVQSDDLSALSTALAAPTSRSARAALFRPVIKIGRLSTRVLIEQLGAFDIERFGTRVGHVTTAELWAIDDALQVVLGL